MDTTAIFLVLLSACMHAGWNFFSKSNSPTLGFFLLSTAGTCICFSPIIFFTYDLLPAMNRNLWGTLLIASFFHATYLTGLAGAYARGALSIAYPLARSLPLLLVTGITFLMGKGGELSLWATLGICAIIIGAFVLPMDTFHDLKWKNYCNTSCAFALVAAIGTTGYTFMDDLGMHQLSVITSPACGWMRAMFFQSVECVFTGIWLTMLLRSSPESRIHLRQHWRIFLGKAIITGIAIGLTYGIILLAMLYASNVSYIIALRQLSIPVGAILGIRFLNERATLPRIFGVAILFTGLTLVALG